MKIVLKMPMFSELMTALRPRPRHRSSGRDFGSFGWDAGMDRTLIAARPRREEVTLMNV